MCFCAGGRYSRVQPVDAGSYCRHRGRSHGGDAEEKQSHSFLRYFCRPRFYLQYFCRLHSPDIDSVVPPSQKSLKVPKMSSQIHNFFYILNNSLNVLFCLFFFLSSSLDDEEDDEEDEDFEDDDEWED